MADVGGFTSWFTGRPPRGLKLEANKHWTEDAPIEVLPTPKELKVPLTQHAGAPARAVVTPRQEVAVTDLLAQDDGFVSARVHSPVFGVVGRPINVTLPNGRHVETLPIACSDAQVSGQELYNDVFGGHWPTSDLPPVPSDAILGAVQAAGIVGQGGTAFPTHVKLTPTPGKPIDTVLVNCIECEPYVTADFRVVLEAPGAVVAGGLLAAQAAGATSVVLAVKANSVQATVALSRACAGTRARVAELGPMYPQGEERQAILAALGRVVPRGGLPRDVGAVVVNAATAAAIARAVLRGRPLTHRVVTVTGRGILTPKNILAPVGAALESLIAFSGGLRPDAARVVAGGPMMGFAVANLKTPVTKATSAITVLTAADLERSAQTPCIRCGRCVDVCPMRLVPTKLALASRAGNWQVVRRYHVEACMECGCCAHVCPARLPLVQLIRMGKARRAEGLPTPPAKAHADA